MDSIQKFQVGITVAAVLSFILFIVLAAAIAFWLKRAQLAKKCQKILEKAQKIKTDGEVIFNEIYQDYRVLDEPYGTRVSHAHPWLNKLREAYADFQNCEDELTIDNTKKPSWWTWICIFPAIIELHQYLKLLQKIRDAEKILARMRTFVAEIILIRNDLAHQADWLRKRRQEVLDQAQRLQNTLTNELRDEPNLDEERLAADQFVTKITDIGDTYLGAEDSRPEDIVTAYQKITPIAAELNTLEKSIAGRHEKRNNIERIYENILAVLFEINQTLTEEGMRERPIVTQVQSAYARYSEEATDVHRLLRDGKYDKAEQIGTRIYRATMVHNQNLKAIIAERERLYLGRVALEQTIREANIWLDTLDLTYQMDQTRAVLDDLHRHVAALIEAEILEDLPALQSTPVMSAAPILELQRTFETNRIAYEAQYKIEQKTIEQISPVAKMTLQNLFGRHRRYTRGVNLDQLQKSLQAIENRWQVFSRIGYIPESELSDLLVKLEQLHKVRVQFEKRFEKAEQKSEQLNHDFQNAREILTSHELKMLLETAASIMERSDGSIFANAQLCLKQHHEQSDMLEQVDADFLAVHTNAMKLSENLTDLETDFKEAFTVRKQSLDELVQTFGDDQQTLERYQEDPVLNMYEYTEVPLANLQAWLMAVAALDTSSLRPIGAHIEKGQVVMAEVKRQLVEIAQHTDHFLDLKARALAMLEEAKTELAEAMQFERELPWGKRHFSTRTTEAEATIQYFSTGLWLVERAEKEYEKLSPSGNRYPLRIALGRLEENVLQTAARAKSEIGNVMDALKYKKGRVEYQISEFRAMSREGDRKARSANNLAWNRAWRQHLLRYVIHSDTKLGESYDEAMEYLREAHQATREILRQFDERIEVV